MHIKKGDSKRFIESNIRILESRFYNFRILAQFLESRFYKTIFYKSKIIKSIILKMITLRNIESRFYAKLRKKIIESRFYKSFKISRKANQANQKNQKNHTSNINQQIQTIPQNKHSQTKIKKLLLILAIFLTHATLLAAPLPFSFSKTLTDVSKEKDGLELDLNRIALNFSQSSLANQSLYSNFSDSNLSGNSQLSLQFFFTFNMNYYSMRFVSFNSMIAEYGFTEITQSDNSIVKNKSLDRLLFSSDYTQRAWDFDLLIESFEAGPFMKASYQTEFNPTPALGRRHIINYVLGAKLFDGKYIKSLYFDLFGEHDLNRTTEFNGFGTEIGLSLEYRLNKSVRFLYSMNYKHYFLNLPNSRILPDYQLLIETRIEATLFKTLSISPTLRYYMLKAKDIEIPASNLILGVSLNFGKVLKPASKPLNKYDFLY